MDISIENETIQKLNRFVWDEIEKGIRRWIEISGTEREQAMLKLIDQLKEQLESALNSRK